MGRGEIVEVEGRGFSVVTSNNGIVMLKATVRHDGEVDKPVIYKAERDLRKES
jgi:hypothetical protein